MITDLKMIKTERSQNVAERKIAWKTNHSTVSQAVPGSNFCWKFLP